MVIEYRLRLTTGTPQLTGELDSDQALLLSALARFPGHLGVATLARFLERALPEPGEARPRIGSSWFKLEDHVRDVFVGARAPDAEEGWRDAILRFEPSDSVRPAFTAVWSDLRARARAPSTENR